MTSSNTNTSPFVIAIDGPAASGKGTLARRLARAFDLPHLDTGLTYRAVAAELLAQNLPLDDEDVRALFQPIYRHIYDWFQDRVDQYEQGSYGSREIGFEIINAPGE